MEQHGDISDVLEVVLGHLVDDDVVESACLDLCEGLLENGLDCSGGESLGVGGR